MGKYFLPILAGILVLGILGFFQDSFSLSIPTADVTNQAGTCDDLAEAQVSEELGEGTAFPLNERISSSSQNTDQGTCGLSGGDNNDWEITITNLSGLDWHNVYLLNDGQRGPIGNRDGFIESCGALLIDNVGVNQPLISESMVSDNVFQAGETWTFIVNDWGPVTGTPGAFDSAGICGDSQGVANSDGSIVAEFFTVPECPPGTIGTPPDCIPIDDERPVGGEFIGVESTALILAGSQMTASWLIPLIVAGIGFAIVIARKL